jgi:hypothetical protein
MLGPWGSTDRSLCAKSIQMKFCNLIDIALDKKSFTFPRKKNHFIKKIYEDGVK